jgi:hypothetical protein
MKISESTLKQTQNAMLQAAKHCGNLAAKKKLEIWAGILGDHFVEEKPKAKFNMLCLGARFSYILPEDHPAHGIVFTKISHNETSKWEEDQIDTGLMDKVFCFDEDGDNSKEVYIEEN